MHTYTWTLTLFFVTAFTDALTKEFQLIQNMFVLNTYI